MMSIFRQLSIKENKEYNLLNQHVRHYKSVVRRNIDEGEKLCLANHIIKDIEKTLRIEYLTNIVLRKKTNRKLLRYMRKINSMMPMNQEVIQISKKIIEEYNYKEIKKLRLELKEHSQVVTVIGCIKKIEILKNTIRNLYDTGFQGRVIGIIGNNKTGEMRLHYDDVSKIVELPCSDCYEDLPEKVAWTCLLVNLIGNRLTMIKCDDDIEFINMEEIQKIIDKMGKQLKDVGGVKIEVNSPLQVDRMWHIGKSKKMNRCTYQGLGLSKWISGGAGYILNKNAIERIAEYSLHTFDFIESELYEDLTISKILKCHNHKFYWLNKEERYAMQNERTLQLQKLSIGDKGR